MMPSASHGCDACFATSAPSRRRKRSWPSRVDRAESLADGVASEPIRRLLHFLVDTVLEPETPLVATNATEAWNNQPIGAR